MAKGELMDNYNATQFLSGIDVTSEKPLYLNENAGPKEHRNLFDESSRCFMGIICAVPISLFFWSIILLIYKAIF
jgi:hypothetical protein